jgi:glutathione S-transferase
MRSVVRAVGPCSPPAQRLEICRAGGNLARMHTLYFTPGACSINPHIVLRELGIPFELVQVDLRTKKTADGGDFRAVSPKGYVPALRLPDGQVLTENAVMVQYLADLAPEKHLAPAPGSFERLRLAETLVFIATELHKGMSPLYNPAAGPEFRAALFERLDLRWRHLASALGEQPYLLGDFSVADAYAFYVMRAWQRVHGQRLPPALVAYYARLSARPSVKAALEAEGLAPE